MQLHTRQYWCFLIGTYSQLFHTIYISVSDHHSQLPSYLSRIKCTFILSDSPPVTTTSCQFRIIIFMWILKLPSTHSGEYPNFPDKLNRNLLLFLNSQRFSMFDHCFIENKCIVIRHQFSKIHILSNFYSVFILFFYRDQDILDLLKTR